LRWQLVENSKLVEAVVSVPTCQSNNRAMFQVYFYSIIALCNLVASWNAEWMLSFDNNLPTEPFCTSYRALWYIKANFQNSIFITETTTSLPKAILECSCTKKYFRSMLNFTFYILQKISKVYFEVRLFSWRWVNIINPC
jgi:hypothetical protein